MVYFLVYFNEGFAFWRLHQLYIHIKPMTSYQLFLSSFTIIFAAFYILM